MAKGLNQKLKLIYIIKILTEKTDDEHGLTMPQLISELDKYDVSAERKSIYDDFMLLETAGFPIDKQKVGNQVFYSLAERIFEIRELKLLVDAIQSSKFITAKQSKELIAKLERFTSVYDAKALNRQVYVQNRVKTLNENAINSVDAIHAAISDNKVIRFQYFSWNVKKQAELRRDGAYYEVSPWSLTWDDENYYLIGYDKESDTIKHYRVDKMLKVKITDLKREGREKFKDFDLASYMKKRFNMFDAPVENVRLEIENSKAGIFIDRFGQNITFIPKDKDHSSLSIEVAVSDAFLGWIFGLGSGIKIVSPPSVVDRVQEMLVRIAEDYK